MAANQGHPFAFYNLGKIYLNNDINKAIEFLSFGDQMDEVNSQFQLGLIYYLPIGVKRNIQLAMEYFGKAAKKNHQKSQCILGRIYSIGEGVVKDIGKAEKYLLASAKQNERYSQCLLGLLYIEKNEIKKGLKYLQMSADQYDEQGLYNLGMVYYEGKYVAQDSEKAIHYFELAIRNGNKFSYNILLNLYLERKNKKVKNEDIIYLYKKGAEIGDFESNFNLAVIYYEGKLTNCDFKKAIYYFKQAANEITEANYILGVIYFEGKTDVISAYNLAHLYFYNEKFKENIDLSIYLLIESIKEKFEPSFHLLSIILVKQIGNISIEKICNYINDIKLASRLFYHIKKYHIDKPNIFMKKYKEFKDIDFMHDFSRDPIISNELYSRKYEEDKRIKVNEEFYNGFGLP